MTKKVSLDNGLTLELINNDFSSKIIYSPKVMGTILIPKSIIFQSQEYTIVEISEGSFINNKLIKQINFTEDSSIKSIKKKSFYNSSIQVIEIPASVEELQEGWCQKTPKLTTISISPSNPHFNYSDQKHQIIIGKSDKTNKEFDVLKFGSRNIQTAEIP